MHSVLAQRYSSYAPVIDCKTGEVIDDGVPKVMQLGQWQDEKVANHFATNVKNSVPKRSWKIWVEKATS